MDVFFLRAVTVKEKEKENEKKRKRKGKLKKKKSFSYYELLSHLNKRSTAQDAVSVYIHIYSFTGINTDKTLSAHYE